MSVHNEKNGIAHDKWRRHDFDLHLSVRGDCFHSVSRHHPGTETREGYNMTSLG